jgi:NADH dehydrogenase FAD-containing subunit
MRGTRGGDGDMSARVLIAGGGIGALAAALALREYAPPGCALSLLAPDPELVLAPETVLEATGGPAAARYSLAAIAEDLGAELVPDVVEAVDVERRQVGTRAHGLLGYDALLLAVGARSGPALPGALRFAGRHDAGALRLAEGGSLPADLVVALPQPAGPAIAGLPADAHGFLPVDRYGRVRDTTGVWAAGDATARPLKQGGLAAQQADVAARSIAAELGGHVAPVAYEPALRGVLLTGAAPRFLRRSALSSVPSAASATPLWSAPGKVADGRVARYLAAHERFRVAAAG